VILPTSVIDNEREKELMRAKGYIPITLFCLIFGWIYELFSFGVYSNYMIYSFVFPFIGGVTFWLLIRTSRKKYYFSKLFINCHSASIATFTMGFIFKGVLDIYGTTSNLCNVYWIVGIIFALIAVLSYQKNRDRQKL
jgi:hypothetical protein